MDVSISRGLVLLPEPLRAGDWYGYPRPEGTYFAFEGVGGFVVRDGREVVVDLHPAAELVRLQRVLQGLALSYVLHQRGCLVLHASAVVIDGVAVAFFGRKGYGKSTTAAALHARGYAILTDDALAVRCERNGTLTALPSWPESRLLPDAAAALGIEAASLSRFHAETEKRVRPLDAGAAVEPTLLRHLFWLEHGAALRVEPLAPSHALAWLLRYGSFDSGYFAREGTLEVHMGRLAHLLRAARPHRLARPRSLDRLPALADAVEAAVRAR